MSDDSEIEELIDIQERVTEIVNDELSMYTGEVDGDKELAWFITDAIINEYVILPSVDNVDASVTIYFSSQALEDLFQFCREKNVNMQAFIQTTIKDAIYK